MPTWYGVNFPFFRGSTILGSSEKVAGRQEDYRLIKNDLLQGLLTIKGERLFRPTFGGDIDRYLFELNDDQTMDDLKESIINQIEIFHPRISVSRVEVKSNVSNPNLMDINVYGKTELDNVNSNGLIVSFQIPSAGNVGNRAQRIVWWLVITQ